MEIGEKAFIDWHEALFILVWDLSNPHKVEVDPMLPSKRSSLPSGFHQAVPRSYRSHVDYVEVNRGPV
jgi:hypothetical protein